MRTTDPQRHGRLPWPTRADLDDGGQGVYDAIASGPRATGPQHFRLTDDAGRLEGPFNALLLAPRVGQAVQELGAAIRYGTSLSARQREIAILVIAATVRSDFEWYAHEGVGRACGLTDSELSAIASGVPAATFDGAEALVHHLAQSLAAARSLTDQDVADAEALLGTAMLVEVVMLAGYYLMLDLSMRAFSTPLPTGVAAPFANVAGD